MTEDTQPNTQIEGLLLPGLDGSNPLGFLAALGLFRVLGLSRQYHAATFYWSAVGGTWVPCISTSIDEHTLLDLLESLLATDIQDHPIRILDQLGKLSAAERKQLLHDCIKNPSAQDWAAALSSSVADPKQNNQLQTARRDYYFGNLKSVIARTKRSHLERTLFHPWDYGDALDNQSLHLDPSEDRRHAYRWNTPASDPDRKKAGGMLGANRLAVEAIPWFASVPEDDLLHTVGFTGNRSTNTRWTWPIWAAPAHTSLIPSLLTLPVLQKEAIIPTDAERLQDQGITAVYRTRRILVGKTPNFTPADQIL